MWLRGYTASAWTVFTRSRQVLGLSDHERWPWRACRLQRLQRLHVAGAGSIEAIDLIDPHTFASACQNCIEQKAPRDLRAQFSKYSYIFGKLTFKTRLQWYGLALQLVSYQVLNHVRQCSRCNRTLWYTASHLISSRLHAVVLDKVFFNILTYFIESRSRNNRLLFWQIRQNACRCNSTRWTKWQTYSAYKRLMSAWL